MTEPQEPELSQTKDYNGCGLEPDERLGNLIANPSELPDVRVLIGFVGRSTRSDRWRLYLTLELDSYLEFHERDCLHSQSLPITEQYPFGGTIVWVRRDAPLQQVQRRITHIGAQDEVLRGGQIFVLTHKCNSDDECGRGRHCEDHKCQHN